MKRNREYEKTYYLINKDKILARSRRYYDENKEAMLKYSKKYREEHMDSCLQYIENRKKKMRIIRKAFRNREHVSTYDLGLLLRVVQGQVRTATKFAKEINKAINNQKHYE